MNPHTPLTVGNWEVVKLLKSGSTASVFLAQDKEQGKSVALKIFNSVEDSEQISRQEADLLKGLAHPRILKYLHYKISGTNLGSGSPETFVLATEYASKGDLLKLIDAFGRLPNFVVCSYFHQMVEGLEYLHSKSIAHGDIKPENILIGSRFNLKFADFGTAAKFSEGSLIERNSGTPFYFSPEKYNQEPHNPFQADLFALGIVLFVMVSGVLPFQYATKEDELYKLILEGTLDEFWQIHEEIIHESQGSFPRGFYKASFKELINNMLCFDPAKRYSFDQIKRCKYYQQATLSDDNLFDFMNQIATKMQY